MKGWDVYLSGKVLTTVYYDADMTREEVYHSLVYYDGYSDHIAVVETL